MINKLKGRDFALLSEEESSPKGKIYPLQKGKTYVNPFPPDENPPRSLLTTSFASWGVKTRPEQVLPIIALQPNIALPDTLNGLYISWLGHSSCMLQIQGVKILIDPLVTNNISPVPGVRIRRYQEQSPLIIDDVSEIDLVFISHNHYDHLDKKAIQALKTKVSLFVVPRGVKRTLCQWGVPEDKIKEFSWWEEDEISTPSGFFLKFACTPARHCSGRGPFSINQSLWVSWVIRSPQYKVFYSGDTSYSFHFRQIGELYGPFDLSLIECGQYNEAWSENHLFPEETVQAHLDIQGVFLLPVHWGSFTIAQHSWWEPITRAIQYAREKGVKIITPRIGETIQLGEIVSEEWWVRYH